MLEVFRVFLPDKTSVNFCYGKFYFLPISAFWIYRKNIVMVNSNFCLLLKYTNADMKIYQHLSLHIKILCRWFCIVTLFTLWDTHTRDIWNVCLQTYRDNTLPVKIKSAKKKSGKNYFSVKILITCTMEL